MHQNVFVVAVHVVVQFFVDLYGVSYIGSFQHTPRPCKSEY